MIGKIQRLKLRDVWKHEALDFTTWLENNIDVLNDALDLKLVNVEREQSAGAFNVDLVAEDEEGGVVIMNTRADLLSDEDHKRLEDKNVTIFNHDATKLALEIGKTELSTNMAMLGACAGVTKIVGLEALDVALQERFGKRYVASGGTATLDQAITKKYAKKAQLLKANMDTITKSYEMADEWAEKAKPALANVAVGVEKAF